MGKILIAGKKDKTINYEKALAFIGAEYVTTLHVPNSLAFDRLILPGGGDIDPILFGQLKTAETRAFDPELDRLQLAILKTFLQDKKPILGICKGMQLINIFFGGDMVQHLPTAVRHEYRETKPGSGTDNYHDVRAVKGSWIDSLYGPYMKVNSAHHQGVSIPGRAIEYSQYADDEVVEALNHRFLPVWGVQWHPERCTGQKGKQGNTCESNYRLANLADGSTLLKWFAKV